MASLISFIVILTLSVLITKIASESLIHTGLSKEAAKFQARSAFTGVGFTTSESESIVKHPVRRKIVLTLMLVGNVGIISALASLMLTFINTGEQGTKTSIMRLAIILGFLGILWSLSKSKWFEKKLVKIINKALEKFTTLKVTDYVELLNLTKDYEITVLTIKEGHWMENKKVGSLKLRQEGLNLIGIQRMKGTYLGTPNGETEIQTGDELILYGRKKTLKNLEKRKRNLMGEREHQKAVKEQENEKVKEERSDNKKQTGKEKEKEQRKEVISHE